MHKRTRWQLIAAIAICASYSLQGVSGSQLQEPRDCTASAQRNPVQSWRVVNLARDHDFAFQEQAAQYDLSRTCCPNNSYIIEWEVVLKTFQAPPPFDDGQKRSLNGTVLPEAKYTYFSTLPGYTTYESWSLEKSLSWDDVQGIALTSLHNKTLLGSLQAKCGLANGTIIAVLPKIGGNLTSDCLNAPGLTVLESQPIRVINSRFSNGIFDYFVIDNFPLPKYLPRNLTNDQVNEDSPYEDFMGLMKVLNLSATTSPSTVDVANVSWSNIPNILGVGSSIGRYSGYSENGSYVPLNPGSAATGFTGLAGCFGPMEIQVFADYLYLDTSTVPGAAGGYEGCLYNSSDELTYSLIGSPAESREGREEYPASDLSNIERFRSKPLVCCPDGEYVRELDVQFRGDSGFLNPGDDGVFSKILWGFTGICSGGTRLPNVSAGNGCTGRERLLEPFNTIVQIGYENEEGQRTAIKYRVRSPYGDYGIESLLGAEPNSTSMSVGTTKIAYLGGDNYTPATRGKRLRVVGLDATATCNGITSLGMVLQTWDQMKEPVNEPGSLSSGAIAGIVVGVLAFVAIIVVAGVTAILINRRKGARRVSDKVPLTVAS